MARVIPSAVIRVARTRRPRSTFLATAGLVFLLAILAAAIVAAQQQSKAQLRTNFALRGTSSARLVSTYLNEQAHREQQSARHFLSGPHVSASQVNLVVDSFGGSAAGLLDNKGILLGVVPSDPKLIGQQFATKYRHFEAAERGKIAVSNVVTSAVNGVPVMAVAVPYSTPQGRRVFSVAYRAASSTLNAFVDHTIAYRQHHVFLVDSAGKLLATSPRTSAATLAGADPTLARAAAHSSNGTVSGVKTPTTFTTAAVPGTPWRLLIAVPNSKLYNSIAGWTKWLPWAVFALVALLGTVLVALLKRSVADRSRLASLSATMERTAQTDSLTGLFNRRALTAHITRVAAQSRRREEPMSVLMIDLDRFKQVNDTHGHEAGDQVLCAVADLMRDALRGDDVYGRWGGDEFVVVLPATDADAARATIGRLRDAAKGVDLRDVGLPDGIPMSIGAATGMHTSTHDLIHSADLALYEAKAAIRDAGNLLAGNQVQANPTTIRSTPRPTPSAPPVTHSGSEHPARRGTDVPASRR
jgi:diguanylate cyclase (GGDEF)-like protein